MDEKKDKIIFTQVKCWKNNHLKDELVRGTALAAFAMTQGGGAPPTQDDSSGPASPAGLDPFSGLGGYVPLHTNPSGPEMEIPP